jgi:hypothetical protein
MHSDRQGSLYHQFLTLRIFLQTRIRRMLNSFGLRDTANLPEPLGRRAYLFLFNIFGNKLKYLLYVFCLFLFVMYAWVVQYNEEYLKEELTKIVVPSHKNETYPMPSPGNQTNNIPTNTNSTLIHDSHKISPYSTLSFWLSIIFSVVSWVAIIQLMQYIRRNSLQSGSNNLFGRQRQNEQMEFLSQLRRMSNLSNIPGLRTRLRLAMLERDFTGDDYEILQELDETPSPFGMVGGPRGRGASEGSINRLPLHTYARSITENSAQTETVSDPTAVDRDRCNICLAGYEPGDELRTISCMHNFHKGCIDPWLRQRNICPICKFPATVEDEEEGEQSIATHN